MVRKILSSIILIMIIYSNLIYATNTDIPGEVTTPSSNGDIREENKITINDESENVSTDKSDANLDESYKDNTITDKSDTNLDNTITDKSDTNLDNTITDKNDTNLDDTNKNINDNEQKNDITQTQIKNSNTVQKSNEARLKELKVDKDGLTPEFDKNTTEYYLIVDLTVKQIKVTTNTVDSKAKVSISGNKNLKKGKNTITIEVKAENGTVKKYYIYVTKVDKVELANAELENLEIEGYSLYPSFKSNIYSYNLNINQNITSLNITPTTQRENATVVIEGNTNLQKGENVIKIIVTAEDNTTVRTYKINTYIDSKKVEIKEENKMPAIILIAGLSVCIITLGIYIIVKKYPH